VGHLPATILQRISYIRLRLGWTTHHGRSAARYGLEGSKNWPSHLLVTRESLGAALASPGALFLLTPAKGIFTKLSPYAEKNFVTLCCDTRRRLGPAKANRSPIPMDAAGPSHQWLSDPRSSRRDNSRLSCDIEHIQLGPQSLVLAPRGHSFGVFPSQRSCGDRYVRI
jgi:hypothetical protein